MYLPYLCVCVWARHVYTRDHLFEGCHVGVYKSRDRVPRIRSIAILRGVLTKGVYRIIRVVLVLVLGFAVGSRAILLSATPIYSL